MQGSHVSGLLCTAVEALLQQLTAHVAAASVSGSPAIWGKHADAAQAGSGAGALGVLAELHLGGLGISGVGLGDLQCLRSLSDARY